MRLVICDDHRLLTEALASMLSAQGHVIEGIAYSADEFLRVVAESDPDVCLLDVNLAGGTEGLTVAREVLERHPRTKVIILSAVSEASVVAEAIDAGVVGFVRKDQNASKIISTLERVAAGEMAIDGDLLRAAVRATPTTPRSDTRRMLSFLTAKERAVLLLLVDGSSTAEIARSMGIATSTARTHVQNVLVKLGAQSRLQASAMVANAGALDELRSGSVGHRRVGG
jgi:two-component system, NarL family, nitrate/nitrite response regulator NarL